MQTEAEKYLIYLLKKLVKQAKKLPNIINLGAAKSTVVEDALVKEGLDFICDRSDIEDCSLNKPYVKNSYISSLEDMKDIPSDSYDLAFANFVMEHIEETKKVASETRRIIKKEGSMVLSLSNPQAPEFKLAKLTPTSFHQLFRKSGHDSAYPVNYHYKTIPNFINIMESKNWKLIEKKYFPATYSYLHRYPILNLIALAYDKLISILKLNKYLGHVVLHFKAK